MVLTRAIADGDGAWRRVAKAAGHRLSDLNRMKKSLSARCFLGDPLSILCNRHFAPATAQLNLTARCHALLITIESSRRTQLRRFYAATFLAASTTLPRTKFRAKIRIAKSPRKRNVFKGLLTGCGEAQPPNAHLKASPLPPGTDYVRRRTKEAAAKGSCSDTRVCKLSMNHCPARRGLRSGSWTAKIGTVAAAPLGS